MKIQDLLQREPFGAILERTLSRYFQQQYGSEFKVCWYGENPGVKAIVAQGFQPWLCRADLNAIFVANAPSEVLDPVRRELYETPVHWRRPLQRAYFGLVSHPWFVERLAKVVIGIKPALPNAAGLLILGGNNRLHILDLPSQRVSFVLKDGFDKQSIQREVEVRQIIQSSHIPEVISLASDGTWFEERYIRGAALNRLPSEYDPVPFEEWAIKLLASLAANTVEAVSVIEYAQSLLVQIEAHLATRMPDDLGWVKTKVRTWARALCIAVEPLAASAGDSIDLTLSHGDFQPGNILLEGDHLWITDWEYSARRQQHYDILVYGLRSRFPRGLARRIGRLIADHRVFHEPPWRAWPNVSDISPDRLHLVVSLFLLEDLLWRVQDNIRPLFFQPDAGWFAFAAEMPSAIRTVMR
ncbi:MAG: hypothetical protein FJ026_10970 [Chloroflexi bacterium]|nr:hypothetical protein [Chloroflexota bacterium]